MDRQAGTQPKVTMEEIAVCLDLMRRFDPEHEDETGLIFAMLSAVDDMRVSRLRCLLSPPAA